MRSASRKKPVAPKAKALRRAGGGAALEPLVAAIARLTPAGSVAVAVSGGSDSLALMHAAAAWARSAKLPPPTVLTLDHKLRAASAGEAKQVAQWAKDIGLRHRTLNWDGQKPATAIPQEARAARYRLLGAWCVAHGARSLLVGHTQDDVAETFLMRLARGSGLDGLATMAPRFALEVDAGTVEVLRPLISFSRTQLRGVLSKIGQDWIDDPTNADSQFERVRLRQSLKALESAGVEPRQIAKSAQRLAEARAALETSVEEAFTRVVRLHDEGFASLRRDVLRDLDPEIERRVLSETVLAIAPHDYAPQHDPLDRLAASLREGRGATLGGCRFMTNRDGVLAVRELKPLMGIVRAIAPGETLIWDRFRVSLSTGGRRAFEVRALGEKGAAAIEKIDVGEMAADRLNDLPAAVRWTLPCLFAGQAPVALPAAGFRNPAYMAQAEGFSAVFTGRAGPGRVLKLLTPM